MANDFIQRGDKFYRVMSNDGARIKLQPASSDGTVRPGRPVEMDVDAYDEWLEAPDVEDVDFVHEGNTLRFISYDHSSESVSAKKLINGKPQRGRPMKIFVDDLASHASDLLADAGLIPEGSQE